MANKKISDLTAVSPPLSGTEKIELESNAGVSGRCTTQDVANLANPMTTSGDIIVGGTSGSASRLAKGIDGTRLGVEGGSVGYYPMYSVQTVTSASTVTPAAGNDKVVISA
jgi:hypothetical protein